MKYIASKILMGALCIELFSSYNFMHAQYPAQSDDSSLVTAQLTMSTLPLFSADSNNKMAIYKQKIMTFNEQTSPIVLQQWLDAFIKDIVTVVVTQGSFTVQNLRDAKGGIDSVIAHLVSLSGKVGPQAATNQRYAGLMNYIQVLKDSSLGIDKRVQAENTLDNSLNSARRMGNARFPAMVQQYMTLIAQLLSENLDSTKADLIKDIENTVNYAKTKGGAELELVRKLLIAAQSSPAFNAQQKGQLQLITLPQEQTKAPIAALAPVPPVAPTLSTALPTSSISTAPKVVGQVSAPAPAQQIAAPSQPTDEGFSNISLVLGVLPTFSSDDKNKLNVYKQKILGFDDQTTAIVLQQWFDAFIRDVVTVAQTQTNVTIENLRDLKSSIEAIISSLATLNNNLGAQVDSNQKRTILSDLIRMLKTRLSDVSKRIGRERTFLEELDGARKIGIENFRDLVARYTSLLQRIDANLSNGSKQEYIKDIEAMATYAKNKGGNEYELFKKLLTSAQNTSAFNASQKGQLLVALQEKPLAGVVAPVTAIPGQFDALIQAKLKDIASKKVLREKIFSFKELLSLITPVTKAEEKAQIVTIITELFNNPGAMNKGELLALKDLYIAVLNHQALLAPNQIAVVEQWIKLIDKMLEFADDKNSLLVSVKSKMKQENYAQAMVATHYALNLLSTKLPKDELDKNRRDSLVWVIRDRTPYFYNKRANKAHDDLKALQALLEAAKGSKEIADVIGKTWQSKLTMGISFVSAKATTDISEKIAEYNKIAQAMESSTDRYEKSMLSDELTALFKDRAKRSVKELESFRELLVLLISPTFKAKKIFDNATLMRFEEYKRIIDATIVLKSVDPDVFPLLDAKVMEQKLRNIQAILPSMNSKLADDEKMRLTKLLAAIFAMRGEMQQESLKMLKEFFEAIEKAGSILDVNQLVVVRTWIKELNDAITIVGNRKSFIQSLLELGVTNKDIPKFTKALALYSKSSSDDSKAILMTNLEKLFSARKDLDKKALQALLATVEQYKTGLHYLLRESQRNDIRTWQSVMESEN